MKIQLRFLFLLVCIYALPLAIEAQSKLSISKLTDDFDYLVKELRLQHNGLYNYESKPVVDKKIDSLRATINRKMTRVEFFALANATIALTNEGHTSASLPKLTRMKTGLSKSFLPLAIGFYNKEAVIGQLYGIEHPQVKRGLKVIAIDGKPISDIIAKIFPYIPTDGFNETSKYEWLSWSFPLIYQMAYGQQNRFEVEVQEWGKTDTYMIELPAIRVTKFKKKHKKLKTKKFSFSDFNYKMLNDSVAYLNILHFSMDKVKYADFLKTQFQKIKASNIQHLVLDLQNNTGGTEGKENLLFHYLVAEPFQRYRHVSMPKKPFLKKQADKDFIADKWTLKGDTAYRGQSTLMSNYFSDLGYQMPDKDLVFTGDLYVLTGGVTFSGGAELCTMLKMQDRAIFIGEETGGTYEGNISGNDIKIELPNSKIDVYIPIMHFCLDVNPEVKGRGLMPDYPVAHSWKDFIDGENSKLNYVLEQLIGKKN